MEKGDEVAVRAFAARVLVDQAHALASQLGERRLDVGDAVRGVVEFRRGIAAEARDRRVVIERAQQLDDRLAGL